MPTGLPARWHTSVPPVTHGAMRQRVPVVAPATITEVGISTGHHRAGQPRHGASDSTADQGRRRAGAVHQSSGVRREHRRPGRRTAQGGAIRRWPPGRRAWCSPEPGPPGGETALCLILSRPPELPVVSCALVVQGKTPRFLRGDAGARPARRSIRTPPRMFRGGVLFVAPRACVMRRGQSCAPLPVHPKELETLLPLSGSALPDVVRGVVRARDPWWMSRRTNSGTHSTYSTSAPSAWRA